MHSGNNTFSFFTENWPHCAHKLLKSRKKYSIFVKSAEFGSRKIFTSRGFRHLAPHILLKHTWNIRYNSTVPVPLFQEEKKYFENKSLLQNNDEKIETKQNKKGIKAEQNKETNANKNQRKKTKKQNKTKSKCWKWHLLGEIHDFS